MTPSAKSARSWRATLLSAAINVVFAFALHGVAQAENVRIGGTGAALGTMNLLAAAYKNIDPAFQLEITPNLGSSGGIKALSSGALQIAVTSRALKPEELAAGLRAYEYGRTAFVLATTKDKVQALTLSQVADLYAGRQTKWGDGQPVRLVLRPQSDGDTALLAAFSPAIKEAQAVAMAREGMVTAMTDQDSADAIERLPGGIGTTSLALLLSERRRARALLIDGVEPSVTNVANGRYPYVKPLFMVYGAAAAPAVLRFIAFVGSEGGRKVLIEAGTDVSTAVAPPPSAAPAAPAPAKPARR